MTKVKDQKIQKLGNAIPIYLGVKGMETHSVPNAQQITSYDIPGMKALVKGYCNRMHQMSQANNSIDLKEESVCVFLDKDILEHMLEQASCEGIMAIFALNKAQGEYPHQTLVLLPCDSNGEALDLENSGCLGFQRWPTRPPLNRLIHPNDPIVVDIDAGIDKFFNDNGID